MRFHVVGGIGAEGEGGPAALGGRLRRLLAGLLANRNGEVGRNDLIAIIWGEDSEPANAEATLRQYVSRLRRALAEVETRGQDLVVTTPTGYRLLAGPGTTDIDEVAGMVARGFRSADFDARFGGQPFGAYGDEPWCHAQAAAVLDLLGRARRLPIAPASTNEVDHNIGPGLPHPATTFIGRNELVRTTYDLLSDPGLVTLTGTGGVGKTRLALAVAHARTESGTHPDGTWFADLSPLGHQADVVGLVARLAGAEVSGPTAMADLARFLARRRCLLVLDNCEHLVDICATFAAAVLDCGGVATILATSRERLDIDGETVIEVPPLAVDSTSVPSPAVRLFAERAVAANPDVDLDDAEGLNDLVTALDGLPLAIELAASRTVVLTVPELMAGLGDRLRLLSPRRRRSRTMEAAIDWSYQLLDPEEQRVFRALGLFVGGADLPAVAAVTGLDPEDALDVVEGLIVKSMVQRATGDPSAARFTMFETLKASALKHLDDEGERDTAEQRFVNHFSDTVGRHPHHYYYSFNFLRSTGDHGPNIVASAHLAVDHERWTDAGWLLKAAVGLTTMVSSSAPLLPAIEACSQHLDEGSTLWEQVTATKTNCYLDASDHRAAAEHAARMTKANDQFTACMATIFLGYLALSGDPHRSLQLIDDHLATNGPDELVDSGLLATTLRVTALAHIGRFDECQAEIVRYLAIEDANGMRHHSGIMVVVTQGVLSWMRGEHDRIHREDLIARYSLADGSLPLSTAIGADLLLALGAAAGGGAEADPVVRRYAGRALGGRARLEANSAATVLAVLAEAEGERARAVDLLHSIGYTSPGVVRLVARELARRLEVELTTPAPLTDTTARRALAAEADRRGWDLEPRYLLDAWGNKAF